MDPLLRSILRWADAQSVQTLVSDLVLGTDDRERQLLAALGGIS